MSRTVSGFQRFRPWHAALRQGGTADPISILGDKLAAWYASGPVVSVPAPSCGITLSGDIAAALPGDLPADVSGQSFSVTDATSGIYIASTPFATAGVRRNMPASGKTVWIEGADFSADAAAVGSYTRVGFTGFDSSSNPIAVVNLRWQESFGFFLELEQPSGTQVALEPMPAQSGGFSIGVGADGQVYFYLRSADEIRNASTLDAAFADAFVGVETLIITGTVSIDSGTGSGGASVLTDQTGMTDRAALGGEDWCGNPIVGSSYVEGLFTTSTGETPVTAAGEPVGLRLDKSKGMELVGNVIADPSFDDAGYWTATAGVAVTGGAAVWTSAASISSVSVANITTLGRTYEITVVVDSISSGVLRVAPSRAGATPSPDITTAGTYTFRIRANGSVNSFIIFSAGESTTASVSSVTCREIAGNHALQSTATARPLWQTGPDRIVYDPVDDALVTTFAAAVGSDCTVARAIPGTGASIATGVSIGTSFTDNVTAQELIIANSALTAGETAALTAYLNSVAGV